MTPDTPADRLARCEPMMHDEVEHVEFDGVIYYLAWDLLEALKDSPEES